MESIYISYYIGDLAGCSMKIAPNGAFFDARRRIQQYLVEAHC